MGPIAPEQAVQASELQFSEDRRRSSQSGLPGGGRYGLSVVKSLTGIREAQRSSDLSEAAQGSQLAHGGPPPAASASVERKDMGFESKTNLSPGIHGRGALGTD